MSPAATTSTSTRQIEANRHNALLSTGPASASGKAISSRNALAHGLTSKHPVLPGESAEEYQIALEAYQAYFQPSDFEQSRMVAELADLRWRLRRIPSYESNLIALEVATIREEQHPETQALSLSCLQALAFKRLIESRVLQNLMNQEARLSRRADRLQAALHTHAQATQQTPPATRQKQEVKNEPIPATAAAPPPSPAKPQPVVNTTKVGRNEACPCGSNLKFKRCCGNPVQL